MDTNFGEYKFSDNKGLIPIDRVCELLENSYWANNRKREINIKANEGLTNLSV